MLQDALYGDCIPPYQVEVGLLLPEHALLQNALGTHVQPYHQLQAGFLLRCVQCAALPVTPHLDRPHNPHHPALAQTTMPSSPHLADHVKPIQLAEQLHECALDLTVC